MQTLKIAFKDLGKGRTPVLTYCRKLIQEGYKSNTRLELYRNREEPDLIVKHLGKASKLGIDEKNGCVFRKYNPPSTLK